MKRVIPVILILIVNILSNQCTAQQSLGGSKGNMSFDSSHTKTDTGKNITLDTTKSFKDRKALSSNKPDCSLNIEGIDVVRISVDRLGNVIEAKGGYKGSTITDSNVIACDEISAKKSKFTPDPYAPALQYGSIRYKHKLQ